MRIIGLVVLLTALSGCAFLEGGETGEAVRRRIRAEADIVEMYRDCLRRKQADPKVDCSEFRTTIEIREAPKR